MSVRDCKGPLWGCLWFVAGWAWLLVFIFANISGPRLYFISICNSMVWILIKPSAQTCFMSEMLLIAWSLMLLSKTCLLSRPKIYFLFSKTEPRLYSLTNGFLGKSLGQLISGWGKGKKWARGLSMHISAPTQSSCNHVLLTSLPVTAWKAWASVWSH